ncbi:MAG: type II secretion system F family protein [Deltaproteobacteria bacterium]|nr:type II secretion system F family protein [Deltaproteobacteria bacterium]
MDEAKRLHALRNSSYDEKLVLKPSKFSFKRDRGSITPGSYDEKLAQAGIELPQNIYIATVVTISLFVGFLGLQLGLVLGIYSFVLVTYFLLFPYLDEKADKRRRMILPQIPSYIDGLMAALGSGSSLEAALAHGTQAVPDGLLRQELETACNSLKSGMTIEEAFEGVRVSIQGREVISLIAALSLFSNMGGRMLEPFQRLAQKIREQQHAVEKATRDLVQVRQAFIILSGLSILAPLLIMIIQPDYLVEAYEDALGRIVLQIAIIMEITALFVYRKIVHIKV